MRGCKLPIDINPKSFSSELSFAFTSISKADSRRVKDSLAETDAKMELQDQSQWEGLIVPQGKPIPAARPEKITPFSAITQEAYTPPTIPNLTLSTYSNKEWVKKKASPFPCIIGETTLARNPPGQESINRPLLFVLLTWLPLLRAEQLRGHGGRASSICSLGLASSYMMLLTALLEDLQ